MSAGGRSPLADVRDAYRRHDVEALGDALRHAKPAVRRSAAYYLGELRDPLGSRFLCSYLRTGNQEFRVLALRALGKVADPSVAPLLYDIATDPAEPFGVRATAISALCVIGDRRAIPLLEEIVVAKNLRTKESLARRDVRSYRRWAAGKLVGLVAVETIPTLEAATRQASFSERRCFRKAIKTLEQHVGEGKRLRSHGTN